VCKVRWGHSCHGHLADLHLLLWEGWFSSRLDGCVRMSLITSLTLRQEVVLR